MTCLDIISVNVRGVATPVKRDLVVSVVSRWSVVFVQESYVCNQRKAESFEKAWGAKCYWSFGGVRSAGVGILVREGLDLEVLDVAREATVIKQAFLSG